METKIVMTNQMYDEMIEKLFPPDNSAEQFGFIVTGVSKHENGHNLLCRKFLYADKSCLVNQSGASVVPDPRFVQYIYNTVKDCHGGLINIHTHPFSDRHVGFSGIDDSSESESFPKEVKYLGEGPHASMVLGRNSVDARWYNAITHQVKPINAIKVIGETGIKILKPASLRTGFQNDTGIDEVHNRQVLAFGKSGQKIIQQQKVGIVGCGGIGSVLFILLVRLGVRDFVLVDHDVVETSNLNRLAGSSVLDAKTGIRKVEMLSNYTRRINPDTTLDLIADSVFSSEAQLALKSCDYIFGGTDSECTRVLLNNISAQHMIPYFDCGTGIQAGKEQDIEHAGGQVRTVIPGFGCLRCVDGIDMDIAHMERLPEERRQFVVQQGYIAGEDEHAPAVASLNGVIANLAVTEFMGYVTGCKPLSRYVFYDFLKPVVAPVEFSKNPYCFSCSQDSLLGSGDSEMLLPEYLFSECLNQV